MSKEEEKPFVKQETDFSAEPDDATKLKMAQAEISVLAGAAMDSAREIIGYKMIMKQLGPEQAQSAFEEAVQALNTKLALARQSVEA